MLGLYASAFAAEKADNSAKKEAVKEHLQNHYKFYGFIRNYFTFDTRESKSGTGELFYYLPNDEKWNMTPEEAAATGYQRADLNAQNQFRFLALTSRVGVDVSGYQISGTKIGAKIEADFYNGLSAVAPGTSKLSGTAVLRLRQAYVTLGWEQEKTSQSLKIGQAWHPMAADMPHVFSLETGAPFNPFSRTPQVTFDANLGKVVTLTAAAIWQMQYNSCGPNGASADYIRNSCVPEFYFGLNLKPAKGLLMRAGVDFLSLVPRTSAVRKYDTGEVDDAGKPIIKEYNEKVKERQNELSPFFYIQYEKGLFSAKAKTVYGSDGSHFNLMGGYAVTAASTNADRYEYASTHSSSTWVSLAYGKKVQGVLFGGYVKNLGTSVDIDPAKLYFCGNGNKNLVSMYRINPEILYNLGKFTFGLEYQLTGVQYGDTKSINARALAADNLHWVINHRVQSMVKFNF